MKHTMKVTVYILLGAAIGITAALYVDYLLLLHTSSQSDIVVLPLYDPSLDGGLQVEQPTAYSFNQLAVPQDIQPAQCIQQVIRSRYCQVQ